MSFVAREQGVAFIEEYDRKFLYPMLVKCYEHLHPLVRLDRIVLTKMFLNKIAIWIFLNKLQAQVNQ
jgi:hypothetical protein